MAKDGFLTAKAIANRIKSKGLQKLRWYCQICEKQCRDENGFKCHCASESHQRKILLVAESPEQYVNDYSAEFQRDFMKLLATRYGSRRVHANLVYQEFIADRTHLHMNATKWATLSEFAMHLGKEGLAVVDETPKGWFMQWVDNSPKTLARQEAIAKKERMEMDDEQREQKLIQQQIEKATALKRQQTEGGEGSGSGGEGADVDEAATELVRENEEEKIKLDISIKPVGLGGGLKLGGVGLLKPKGLNALAAKKPSVFSSKSSSSATTAAAATTAILSSTQTTTGPPKKRSAMEEIMEREMAKKKRLEEMNSKPKEDDRRREGNIDHHSSREVRDSRDSGDSRDDRGHDRDRDYRSSRDGRDDRDRDYRSSKDSRDDRDREHRSSRDSRDDRDRDYRSSRDSRDDRDRDSRDSRDSRDRESSNRDRDSYRDRERERNRDRS